MDSKSKTSLSKDDLRKLMKEKKANKKIEHPLAKYNNIGQLICVCCQTVIKSEIVWSAHLLSKSHKQNFESFKKPSKRTLDKEHSSDSGPIKKITLVKPSSESGPVSLVSNYDEDKETTTNKLERKPDVVNKSTDPLPDDFFDSKVTKRVISTPVNSTIPSKKESEVKDSALPEGFFDDPYVDAKVRQVPFKEKFDEEYELFQKAMKEVSHKSEQIIEEDEEKLMSRRNLSEVEEQIYRWSKINQLEMKKEILTTKVHSSNIDVQKSTSMINGDESSDEDVDPEDLNWRNKNS